MTCPYTPTVSLTHGLLFFPFFFLSFSFLGDHLSGFEMLEPSSLVRPPGNNNSPCQSSMVDNEVLVSKEKATAETSSKSFCAGEGELHLIGHENSLKDKSEESHVTSSKVCYSEESQQPVLTVQITHFAVGKNSDVKTTTVKSPVLTDNQRSKSPSVFSPFSPRSSSFIERARKASVLEYKPRSRSLANDVIAVEVISSSGIVNIPEKTNPEKYDSLKRQRSTDLTGELLDTRRFKSDEKLPLDISPNLSKSKSFESVLSNIRCKAESPQYRDLDLPPYRSHSSVLKDGQLQGFGYWSCSESDLTYTLPETGFLTENRSPGRHQVSFIAGTQGKIDRQKSKVQFRVNDIYG